MENTSTSNSVRSLTCPVCEAGELQPLGSGSARCDSCGALLSGTVLRTLRQIMGLPDVVGGHACECGHPEMRRLPDGVYWCPACGSEVLPIEAPPSPWKGHSEAYWSGWMDGRFKEFESLAECRTLSRWQDAESRLDYYRGHRAGREERLSKSRKVRLLKAS
jgi:ribosomal protein L37AE/L43A